MTIYNLPGPPVERTMNFNKDLANDAWVKSKAGTLWRFGEGSQDVPKGWHNLYYIPEGPVKRDPEYYFDYEWVGIDISLPVLKLGEAIEVRASWEDGDDKTTAIFHKVMVTTEHSEQKVGWIGKDAIAQLELCQENEKNG